MVIHCFVPLHPSKIGIRKTIDPQELFVRRFHDQSLVRGSFKIITNMLVHKLWENIFLAAQLTV